MNRPVPAQRPPARHEEIVAAARALAVAEGWGAVSVRRIAARVGCSAAAIYQYLPDKESILKAIAEDGARRLAEAMTAAMAEAGGPGKRLRAAARAYGQFVIENPAIYEVLPHAAERRRVTEALHEPAAALVRKHELALAPEDIADAVAATLHGFAVSLLDGRLGAPERALALLAATVDALVRGFGRR